MMAEKVNNCRPTRPNFLNQTCNTTSKIVDIITKSKVKNTEKAQITTIKHKKLYIKISSQERSMHYERKDCCPCHKHGRQILTRLNKLVDGTTKMQKVTGHQWPSNEVDHQAMILLQTSASRKRYLLFVCSCLRLATLLAIYCPYKKKSLYSLVQRRKHTIRRVSLSCNRKEA